MYYKCEGINLVKGTTRTEAGCVHTRMGNVRRIRDGAGERQVWQDAVDAQGDGVNAGCGGCSGEGQGGVWVWQAGGHRRGCVIYLSGGGGKKRD